MRVDSTYRMAAVFVLVSLLHSTLAMATVDGQALAVLQNAKAGADADSQALARAWQLVAAADLEDLPAIMSAFDGATPVGANWLSSALDRVLQQASLAGRSPSVEMLQAFVGDASHQPLGRETALEILRDRDPAAAASAVAALIKDPSARLRRGAVQKLLERAEEQPDEAKVAIYQKAFQAAVDEDQVVKCVVALRGLGHPVDHIKKFGFLMRWQIMGPFDYQDGEGFDAVYPPERMNLDNYDGKEGIFSDSEIEGKNGPVQWTKFVSSARNGIVDLNKAIDELRDVVAYGATIYESDKPRDLQLRLRQQNACKVWLNGELVFDQPIGHTGNFFDQYTVPVRMRAGKNLIVIKSCQFAEEANHPFLKNWQFGVRVCNATGEAVLAKNRQPTPELDPLPQQAPASDDEATEEAGEGDLAAEESKDDIDKVEGK